MACPMFAEDMRAHWPHVLKVHYIFFRKCPQKNVDSATYLWLFNSAATIQTARHTTCFLLCFTVGERTRGVFVATLLQVRGHDRRPPSENSTDARTSPTYGVVIPSSLSQIPDRLTKKVPRTHPPCRNKDMHLPQWETRVSGASATTYNHERNPPPHLQPPSSQAHLLSHLQANHIYSAIFKPSSTHFASPQPSPRTHPRTTP